MVRHKIKKIYKSLLKDVPLKLILKSMIKEEISSLEP